MSRTKLVTFTIFLISFFGMVAQTAKAQAEDTTIPALAEFDFNPKTVDVSSGPQIITITMRITDDLSGFDFGNFLILSPSGQQVISGGYNSANRISGNSLDGVYEVVATVPQFSEAGTWHVIQVFMKDLVGNTVNIGETTLIGQGFPTELVVIGGPDLAPPDVAQFNFSPTSIDVSAGPQTLNITLRITDNLSGFDFGNFLFLSPSGQQVLAGGYNSFNRVSGDANDGIYQVSATVPQFSEAGTWRAIQVFMKDLVGNTINLGEADLTNRGAQTQLQIISNPHDIVPPAVAEFSFSPTTVDTTAAARPVTVTLRITDNLAGFDFGNFLFLSPSGQQVLVGGYNSSNRLSGNAHDGIYEVTSTLPQFSEIGTWHVIQVFMKDLVGNTIALGEQDLINLGATTTLNVVQSCNQLTALGPARAWIGLKNSDDVGTRFDLRAEVFKNGVVVGSGQLNAIPGGGSGFNNAVARTINLALSAPVDICPGDTLSLSLSVRIAVGVSGHRSGTARLWFNDSAADSQFSATIGGTASPLFLLDGFALGTVMGPGPKKTIDVFVDRAVGGNPFKPFGVWSRTF